ncbi:MAG: secondary thiamine-phosphate synthase enzyme YjbQ, partial [Acidobacteriota bacterium]|nr:secondary thiamine-phosphate synthase enzyme YjbQ [Acidobacteriota bacterium]
MSSDPSPRLHRFDLRFPTTAGTDILDMTPDLEARLAESGVTRGQLLVFVPGSTGAVTTIEYESGCLEDLRTALERVAPVDGEYAHNLRWDDGNGYSHLRAALIGPSLTLPIEGGHLVHGTWQQ